MSDMKPQVRAAKRGFLCARQLADIREVARIARTEGITINVHGVIAGGLDTCGKENVQHANTIAESAKHIGRGPLPTEAEGSTCEKPKKLTRSALRQKDYLCGKRWAPLAQALLRRCRAKLRCDVWTEGMRAKLALRNKMCDLVRRAWAQRTKSIASPSSPVFGPESFLSDEAYDEAADEAEEERQVQEAIRLSLAAGATDSAAPSDDHGECAGHFSTPPKKTNGGRKSRGGKKSSKPR